jgi:hypothetical protein
VSALDAAILVAAGTGSPAVPSPTATLVPDWLTHAPVFVDPTWADRAQCARDPDVERWTDLPPLRIRGRVNPAYQQHVDGLRATCLDCPVRAVCAQVSLTSGVCGVWAGLDDFDRMDLRALLALPEPGPVTLDGVSGAPTESDALRARVRYLAARTDLTLAAIADLVGVTAMAVTRLLDERENAGARRRST